MIYKVRKKKILKLDVITSSKNPIAIKLNVFIILNGINCCRYNFPLCRSNFRDNLINSCDDVIIAYVAVLIISSFDSRKFLFTIKVVRNSTEKRRKPAISFCKYQTANKITDIKSK